MRQQPPKIVLPTTDTCRFRRDVAQDGDGESAVCGLIEILLPGGDPETCRVPRAVCEACCRSFPPSAELLNPVVASVSYEIANRMLAHGEGQNGGEPARRLKRLAERGLDMVCAAESSLIPGRVSQPCAYLGKILADRMAEPGFECLHPDHGTTTRAECRACPDWSQTLPISTVLSLDELLPRPAQRSGPVAVHWAVGVTTAPRRQATLEWCLDSLTAAGWEWPHLFLDGTVRIPERYAHLPITWREKSVGAWPSYFLALNELLMREPDADAYFLLQDDAIVYDRHNLCEYLGRALWPGSRPGVVSLYCPEVYNHPGAGWRRLDEAWLWGALAFVFPAALARAFVCDREVVAHRWNRPDVGKVGIDSLVGEWMRVRNVDIWYPVPSLAQHVGNTSAIWQEADNTGPRRADWFAGDIDSPFAAGASFDEFPESAFECRPEQADEYRALVERGRQRMRGARVVICGLCRDVRHSLPRTAARIERLGKMFGGHAIVLFENDSTDSTLPFLCDWKRQNPEVHVLHERLGTVRFPQIRSGERAARLAEYRNRCREYALEKFPDYEFMIVVDTDLAGGWSFDGIASTFGHDAWDFVGSNGIMRRRRVPSGNQPNYIHFDAWAFRKANHPEPHGNDEINDLVYLRGEPLVDVWSCFGGLGIYRLECLRNVAYGGPDCEHAVLHQRMRARGFDRMYLNPSQIVLYTNSLAPLP